MNESLKTHSFNTCLKRPPLSTSLLACLLCIGLESVLFRPNTLREIHTTAISSYSVTCMVTNQNEETVMAVPVLCQYFFFSVNGVLFLVTRQGH